MDAYFFTLDKYQATYISDFCDTPAGIGANFQTDRQTDAEVEIFIRFFPLIELYLNVPE